MIKMIQLQFYVCDIELFDNISVGCISKLLNGIRLMILQEKTEAEMKQFRKALNFKAAPMPSFYNAAKASRPDGSKVNKFIAF